MQWFNEAALLVTAQDTGVEKHIKLCYTCVDIVAHVMLITVLDMVVMQHLAQSHDMHTSFGKVQ